MMGARQAGHLFYAAILVAVCGCWRGSAPDGPDELAAREAAAAQMGQFRYADAVATLSPFEGPSASPGARVDLAIALLNRREGDDTERSTALLDSVLKGSPDNLRAQYCRALLAFNAGEDKLARELFERVSEADPDDPYALYYVGQCLATTGDCEGAVEWFERAHRADPYLRSAYYGKFQCLQRTGQPEAAREAFALFQRLGENPRSRLAELKYTRMGPKSEVAPPAPTPGPSPKPEGPVFAEPVELPLSPSIEWPGEGYAAQNATVADADGDSLLDLLLVGPGGETLLLLNTNAGFEPALDHPLTGVADVNAALWGDYDDDGLTDVYLCRNDANQLWRQTERGEWADVSDETETAGAGQETVDGVCYDLDHDGDLDYLLVNRDGPVEVLSNDRDGAFRPIADELGIDASGASRVVVADLDRDDDADLLLVRSGAPHLVYRNDRLWRYEPADGFNALVGADFGAAVAIDADVDGQTEIYTAGAKGVERWAPNDAGDWSSKRLSDSAASQIAAYDVDGDTRVELLVREADRWRLLSADDGAEVESHAFDGVVGDLAVMVREWGPEVVGLVDGAPPRVWTAGGGRHSFALVRPVGRTDKADEMRSNASGIGVLGVARVDRRWAPLPSARPTSSVGQSLQPWAIGSAGAERIDFVRLLWPDGVSQTEVDLPVGTLTVVPETQRQAGSCPLAFVWDGEQFRFVADLLGAGGIGFNVGRGEYYPPRPEESLLLPAGLLVANDGRYTIKLGEPMEEVCYFDAVQLVAYDLPPDWSMTLDERFAGLGPAPTGEPVYYQHVVAPTRSVNERGDDVTIELAEADNTAAPLRRDDRRFIGLTEPTSVTLEFDEPIDSLESPVLLFDGWVEYAYSQSAFAAWQAGAEFLEPTIEAQGADGEWRVVAERFGYPAGTSRQGSVALPIEALPKETKKLRISTTMQVYWDRLVVVDQRGCPDSIRTEAALVAADVRDVGFSERRLFDQRRSAYDYGSRPPFGDTRHPTGHYTAFGDAMPLVDVVDDAVAIIGPGEEVHLEFDASLDPAPPGWTRRWVLEASGWCKDRDLFTEDSGSVGPLPRREGGRFDESSEARREKLHAEYNTRLRSGY